MIVDKNSGHKMLAFKMMVNADKIEAYKQRHDDIWPELVSLLKSVGIVNYHIFYDPQSQSLFACMQCPVSFTSDCLNNEPVMQRWWQYMADIMQTHDNHQPVSVPLELVFNLNSH